MYSFLWFFKQNVGFCNSIIRCRVDDAALYGNEVQLIKDGAVIRTGTIGTDGLLDLVTDESGNLTAKMPSRNITVNFKVTFYGTYNVNFNIHSASGLGDGAGK